MFRIKVIIPFIAIFLLFSSQSGMSQDPKTRFKIDCHYHYRGNSPGWVEETVKTYRKYNTIACVITGFKDLEAMKELFEKYPDVFIGTGRIDLDSPDAIEHIDAFYLAGFKYIGEITTPGKPYIDESYWPIYQRAETLGMAIQFHTGIRGRRAPWIPGTQEEGLGVPMKKSGLDYQRPHFLDIIARCFPKTYIIGAHLGNPEYDVAAESLRWNPNLFYDVTGSTLIKKDKNPEYWSDILWWRPSTSTRHSPGYDGGHAFGKIIFGTDEGPSGLLPNIERFGKFLKANNVPESVQKQCWSGTMARILGITPRPDF